MIKLNVIFFIGAGLLAGIRGLMVHNYINTKKRKQKDNIFQFINNDPNFIIKTILIIPFFSKSENDEILRMRNNINKLTYAIYMFFIQYFYFLYN